jgi:DNA replication protein DnaC
MEKEETTLTASLKSMGVTVNYNAYDHIELTEEELKIILYNAKKAKAGKLKEAEYWKKVTTENQIQVMGYTETLVFYQKKLKEMYTEFVFDEYNEKIFEKLCLYFSDLSSKKGILLAGPIGCGKTSLMNVFALNQKSSYQVVSCRNVGFEYSQKGIEAIEQHIANIESGTNIFGQKLFGKCFDDLGAENPSIKRFGNEINVMEEIFLSRYDKINSSNYTVTHCTTNLTIQEIKDLYGDRVLSRFKEMFNMIAFNSESPDRRCNL